jgi:hypothetical protein
MERVLGGVDVIGATARAVAGIIEPAMEAVTSPQTSSSGYRRHAVLGRAARKLGAVVKIEIAPA